MPYLATCLDWALGRTDAWYGPLLLQPTDLKVVARESTLPDAGVNVPQRLKNLVGAG